MNLGREGADPTLPAYTLLQELCRYGSKNDNGDDRIRMENGINYAPYIAMLPAYNGADCLGSTDFFSESALEALQVPFVRDETLERRELTKARFERDVQPMLDIAKSGGNNVFARGIDNEEDSLAVSHLLYAVWLITSRVLTVQGEANSNTAYRLMIPLIDMCNHDRSSPHVLSGRAVPGGTLRVVAGADIAPGEQINICYGGGVAGNDRERDRANVAH